MRPALLGTLKDLQLDYLDLYLVGLNCKYSNFLHSPSCMRIAPHIALYLTYKCLVIKPAPYCRSGRSCVEEGISSTALCDCSGCRIFSN